MGRAAIEKEFATNFAGPLQGHQNLNTTVKKNGAWTLASNADIPSQPPVK